MLKFNPINCHISIIPSLSIHISYLLTECKVKYYGRVVRLTAPKHEGEYLSV